jgi:hypothetical protein
MSNPTTKTVTVALDVHKASVRLAAVRADELGLVPARPGERVKTDPRDARKPARLHAGGARTDLGPATWCAPARTPASTEAAPDGSQSCRPDRRMSV